MQLKRVTGLRLISVGLLMARLSCLPTKSIQYWFKELATGTAIAS